MRCNIYHFLVTVAAGAALTTLMTAPAPAQQAPAPRGVTRPADEVLAQIGQSAGAIVLADSTVQARLPVPSRPATPDTLEQQLAEIVRVLPPGTTVVKLYAPAPANGRWVADIVADYARAQARLVGTTGRPAPAGMVEIFGRPLPVDKVNEYAAALNLKLVYLVTNHQTQSASTAAAVNWAGMNSDQRQLYVQQQAQRLLSLDPATRLQMLRQMMQQREPSPQDLLFKAVMSQMSDAERMQFKQSFAEGEGKGK